VECTGDNVCLLFGSKLDEVYCIAGYADGKLRIVLRMCLRIKKSLSVKYVNIKVMTALGYITVK
jgi:hypothetical protein